MKKALLGVLAFALSGAGVTFAGSVPIQAAGTDPSQVGAFSGTFEDDPTNTTYSQVVTDPNGPQTEHCKPSQDPTLKYGPCKPGGATEVVLPNGKILVWDALAGTENIKYSTTSDFAAYALNDQVRVLSLGSQTFTPTNPSDGGANPGSTGSGVTNCLVPATCTYPGKAYGDLFCSDQVLLADGTLLAVGGTSYYQDPGIPGTNLGAVELQGLKNGRIYNPATNDWTQTRNQMTYGRWYPSLVTLPSGKVFIASGVTKLLKPAYPDRPTDSGRNVTQTETYDPATQTFADNSNGQVLAASSRSLPLYPRLHLLPDGKVYYDAGGQTYNPFGEAVDEASWNIAATYDPAGNSWTSLGIPGVGTSSAGFRGSAFSQMLPLRADSTGKYTTASFLSAGGVPGTTPGTVVATNTSEINTINTAGSDALTTVATGALNNRRWYSTGVSLPDGTVLAFSGASLDEVVQPGAGTPVTQAELFTPQYDNNGVPSGGSWTPLASANRGRTYHNAAILLPDGRVLVGGHAPIPNGYGTVQSNPPKGTFSNNERDPSFEIYSPPYLFRGPRPQILGASVPGGYGAGQAITVKSPDAAGVTSVVLVRNTALTHLVDGDQRTVVLPILERDGANLTVAAPPGPAVAPPGPYLLFALNARGVPSVAAQVSIGTGPNSVGTLTAVANAARPHTTTAPPATARAKAGAASAATPEPRLVTHTAAAIGRRVPGPLVPLALSVLLLAAWGGLRLRRRRAPG